MIDSVEDESAATAGFFQLHLESVEELKKQFNDEETFLQPSLTRSMTVGGNVQGQSCPWEKGERQSLAQRREVSVQALPSMHTSAKFSSMTSRYRCI